VYTVYSQNLFSAQEKFQSPRTLNEVVHDVIKYLLNFFSEARRLHSFSWLQCCITPCSAFCSAWFWHVSYTYASHNLEWYWWTWRCERQAETGIGVI